MPGSGRPPRRLAVLAVLLAAAAVASCLAEDAPPEPSPDEPPASTPRPGTFSTFANVSTELPGAEPVVDVGPEGTLYLQGKGLYSERDETGILRVSCCRSTVWRSADDGASWEEVSPPDTGHRSSADGFVAAAPDGSVYAANAYAPNVEQGPVQERPAGTLELFRSDDRGDSWDRLAPPQPSQKIHRMWLVPEDGRTLHLTVATKGPDAGASPLFYMRSDDRGDTWTGPVLVHESRSFGTNLVQAPDGTLHVAVWTPAQDHDWTLFSSTDQGTTWQARSFGPDGTGEGFASSWHPLVAGPDGEMHLAWAEAVDGEVRVRYVSSTDGGDTWTQARPLVDVEGEAMLPWATSAGADALDVVFYATAGDAGEGNSTWQAYHARVANATGAPVTERLHAGDRPVHAGRLCTSGTCAGQGAGEGNPLLDFTWVTRGPDDRVHAAFAASTWEEPSAFPVYAAPPGG